ncbi:hypothetical protein A3K64_01920 [Candidatus Micrarchaeota archaeon RBG_16_36_9]|nr:MAG: hypothetical protein A3K64_01920 [Candidatus Micrarchaeota archaeon RBG_16_36_9]
MVLDIVINQVVGITVVMKLVQIRQTTLNVTGKNLTIVNNKVAGIIIHLVRVMLTVHASGILQVLALKKVAGNI